MTAQSKGELSITMLSDWHVGTGAGRPGELDRLVARDADGLPYIPAKTVIGMWRDGCERIAYGLDSGAIGAWTGWVDEIFGDEPTRRGPGPAPAAPAEAALSLRPARLSQTLRQGLCELHPYPAQPKEESKEAYEAAKKHWDDKRLRRERLRAGLTLPKPGVAIDAYTGRARDDFLSMEEMARGGLTLVAPFELRATSRSGAEWTDEHWSTMTALLVAAASEIERLGGKRRRGAGRCEAKIGGFTDLEAVLARFDCAPSARPDNKEPDSAIVSMSQAREKWWSLAIRLELLTPVVAAAATVGNVVESLDYVPGSLLLPVVARLLHSHGVDDPAAEIAAGNVIVLPATVEIKVNGEGKRGLPVPFALHVPKAEQGLGRARNRLIEPEPDQPAEEERDQDEPRVLSRQAKRVGYVVSAGAGQPIPHRKVELAVTTHSTIAEEEQRPTEAVGGVFSYQAIPVGTKLRSEIRLRRGLADGPPAGWGDQLGEARLGRSKKDDYGLVRITAAGPWKSLLEPDPSRIPAVDGSQELRLWIVSDLLLRDEGLRPSVDHAALKATLADALGVKPEHLCLGKPAAEGRLGADLRVRRYDGWQARWGLPRPSLVGLQAGSCLRIVIAAGNSVNAERIAKIEAEGLGERRAEGFGQVRFEDPLLTERSEGRSVWSENETPTSSSAAIETGDADYAVATVIERAAWRKAIAEAATAMALAKDHRETVFGFTGKRPGPSQLGALRSHIAGLTEPAKPGGTLLIWLDGVKRRRANRWPLGCPEKLEKLLTKQEAVWEHLEIHKLVEPLTADCRDRLECELWGEAVAAAIGAAMRAQIFAARREEIGESADA